ncbi:hypothetical protein BS17DRAFT_419322 [Gyrodon lividus]|nr:hypothetical protein BS17DRAFT_419322 [Gyrodon lividus]
MAQTDSSASSRKTARNKYSPLSNTFLATGTTYGPGSPPSSGVVPYPGTGMNPFLLTLPPHAHVSTYNRNLSQTGTGSGSGSEYTSSDSTQPPTPTASSFPRTMVSAQSGIQLQPWYPWLHSQPQLQAYPTQPQVSSLPQLQSTSSISGSQPSSVPSPASTSEQRSTATPVQSGPVTDFSSLLELLLIPLKAFQTQFTAFEAHFSTVQTDMKDVLTELRTIRNAQKQMGKRMGVLEDVIGVSTGKSARARGRGRGRGRGKGRARGGNMSVEEVQIELEPDMEGAEIGFEPENSPTFLHRFAAIESAIEELLSRESGLCKAREFIFSSPFYKYKPQLRVRCGGYDYPADPPVIHPLPLPRHPPVTSDTAPEIPLPQLATAPLLQQPKLNPPVTLPAYYQQSTASSVPSPILALPPESGTLPLCTVTKQYTDASVFACPSPPPPQAPCALPFPSHSHGPGLTPADWNGNSARLSTYTSEYLPHFSRLHASQSTSAMAMSDPNSPTRCPGSTVGSLRRLMLPFAHSPIRTSYTMSAPNLCQRSEIILDAEAGNQALQEAGVSMSAPASASQERVTTPPIRDTSHAQHATLWPSTRVARSISIPPLDLIPGHAPDSEGSLALQPARPLPSFVHIQLADNKIEVSSEQPLPSPPTSSPYTPRSESDRARSASASCDLANEELEGLAERDGRESQAGSGPEDIQMAIEAEVGSIPEVSVTNERTMSPEPVPPEIEDRGVSHPAGEGKASSRPSIPLLESSADIRSPCEPRTESAPLPNISNEAELATEEVLISPTPLRPESPMMATPPSLTPPPPSLEQEQVAHQSLIQQHSLKYRPKRGLFPRIRSLLTPPPPSPSPFEVREIGKEDGSAPVGRAGGDADTVMEVAVSAPDDAGPAVHDAGGAEGADTLKRNGGTSLGRDRAVVVQKVGPSSSAGLENAILVPAITITYSPEPVNASSSHSPANEHDLAHPSPPQHPVASAVSSRDLMPGTPETTTSILDSISRSPSVHPSTSENEYRVELPLYQPLSSSTSALLAINPSMLHDRTSLPLGPKFPGAPYIPERLLSPLTSLDEDGNTKVDSNSRPLGDGAHISAHHSRGRGEQRGPTPSGFSIGRRRGASANGNRGHRSEPYHPPSTSHTLSHFNPNAPHLTNSMPHVRAASEASSSASVRSRSLGGPGASSNELAILARREPLRIHLKVPVSMRGQKRKWGVVDSEVVQEEASTGGGSGTGADAGRESAVIGTGEDDEMRDRQEEESGGSVSAAVRRRRSLFVMNC